MSSLEAPNTAYPSYVTAVFGNRDLASCVIEVIKKGNLIHGLVGLAGANQLFSKLVRGIWQREL